MSLSTALRGALVLIARDLVAGGEPADYNLMRAIGTMIHNGTPTATATEAMLNDELRPHGMSVELVDRSRVSQPPMIGMIFALHGHSAGDPKFFTIVKAGRFAMYYLDPA